MDLTLTRDIFAPDHTGGILTVDGLSFGFTMEDRDRGLDAAMPLADIKAVKVSARTAIPTGRYRVKRTHSPKYGRLMPLLLDVPGYRGVRAHAGNTAADTEGCILPGLTRRDGFVGKSAAAAGWLDRHIADAELRGDEVWIEVRRVDGAVLA